MAGLIYSLCAITALLSSVMLLRTYRRSSYRLLLWSGLAFLGLALSNFILILDKLLYPQADLLTMRLLITLVSMVFLIYGLIWDSD